MSNNVIDVHTTSIHPLSPAEIDESCTTENVELFKFVMKKLDMDQKTVKKYILLVGGDQLSLACQQAILIGCLCHEAGIEA